MSGEGKLQLQIVVNDEIVDLRNKNFEKHNIRTCKSSSKSASPQFKKDRRCDELQVNGLKKLANNLYFGSSSQLLQKSRNTIRNKLKGRAASADPRFRRERSPMPNKKPLFSQSDSLFSSKVQKPPHKTQTQSTPTFVMDTERSEEKTQIYNSINKKPTHGTMTELEEKNIQSKGSNYESAITNIKPSKSTHDDSSNLTTIVNFPKAKSEKISPYWDDPRLIKKYSKILKPIPVKRTKSSWTLPLANQITSNICCANCSTKESNPMTESCKYDEGAETYKFDGGTDLEEMSMQLEKAKYKLYETFLKNYCLTPFFLLGSICGLILVTSIIWVFANDFLWKSLSPSIQKENKTFGQWLFAYLGGAALYALNSIFKTISSVLSLQRNEVLNYFHDENINNWGYIFR